MEVLIYSFRAILPILLPIALGYFLVQRGRLPVSFYKDLNGLCFRVFLPIQMAYNTYQLQSASDLNWGVLGFLVVMTFFTIILGMILAKLFVPDPLRKGAFVQGAYRSNTVILGITLVNALGGSPKALLFATIAVSTIVPLYNIAAVVVLEAYGTTGGKPSLEKTLKGILKNPLIIGTACGLLCVLIRALLPRVDGVPVFTIQNELLAIYNTVSTLSKVASPVMLVCLGAQLNFTESKSSIPQIALGVFTRLVFVPLAGFSLAIALHNVIGLTIDEVPTLIACLATPVAVSSVVMVQETGGDHQFAAQVVVWSSVLCLPTIFCITAILRSLGWL